MKSSSQNAPQGNGASSMLRRDVQVYDQGRAVRSLPAHPVRLMADGRIGVAFEGWVYPLLKGNIIVLGEPAHKDRSGLTNRVVQEPPPVIDSKESGQERAVQRWTFESNGPVHYIKCDALDDVKERLIVQLNASGLGPIRCVRSARRARDGNTYSWSIRLGFSGPRLECKQRVCEILEHFESGLTEVDQRHRTETEVATKSEFSWPGTQPRLKPGEQSTNDVAGEAENLPFEILPPDSNVRRVATRIGKAGNYAEQELDLMRLQVLAYIERHFADLDLENSRADSPQTRRTIDTWCSYLTHRVAVRMRSQSVL
jgi:hypothetical protein